MTIKHEITSIHNHILWMSIKTGNPKGASH